MPIRLRKIQKTLPEWLWRAGDEKRSLPRTWKGACDFPGTISESCTQAGNMMGAGSAGESEGSIGEEESMIIHTTNENGSMTIMLEGRLDTVSAAQLEETLMEKIGDAVHLTFDFSKLEYLSSAGLRLLIAAEKTMEEKSGSMVIRNINSTIKDIFDVTGFSDILTIE